MMAISSLMSGAVRPAAGSSSSSSCGFERQRPGDLQQALLAVRQVARFLVGQVGQADEVEQARPRARAPRVFLAPVARRVQRHVDRCCCRRCGAGRPARSRSAVISPNSCTFWKVRAMPDSGDVRRACGRTIERPAKSISPAVGLVDAGQHVHHRALARAVGADQAVHGAALGTCRSTWLSAFRPPNCISTLLRLEQVAA